MTTERDPIGNDGRRAARRRRLGKDASCLRCGYENPAALVAVDRTLLEEHHVAGRANDPQFTTPLCRNCHAELTETNRVYGIPMTTPQNTTERTINTLRGLAVFLPELGTSCARLAADLERHRPPSQSDAHGDVD